MNATQTISRTRCGKRQAGFTLLEMAIVVALIGLVLMISLPNVVARLPAYRVEAAADRLAIQMHAARIRAMTEGLYVGIKLDTNSRGLKIWTAERRDFAAPAIETQTFDLGDLKDVQFQTYPEKGLFTPGGMFHTSESWGGVLWIWIYSNKTLERRMVIVWSSGQVQVYKYHEHSA